MTTESILTPAITKEALIKKVENLVQSDGLTYLEAIISICGELDVDPEDIAKMITGPLKDKLECESQRNHMIRGFHTDTISLYDV